VPILEARALTKTYRLGEERVVGVVDASLTLEKQSFAVLAGPSGSGKTTLLNLLGLLDTPDAGRLVFEGATPRLSTNGAGPGCGASAWGSFSRRTSSFRS